MGLKLSIAVMTTLAGLYLFFMFERGLVLLADDNFLIKVFGLLLFVFPMVAAWGIWRELSFGFKSERLAKKIEPEVFEALEFEFRPSGRPTKESSMRVFAKIKELTEQDPTLWQNWYLLALAYEGNGDRTRARKCVREAIALAEVDSKLS